MMAEASRRGHAATDKEGVSVGRRVRLPRGAAEPIRVYINGIEQERGSDYKLHEGQVVFADPIIKEGKLSGWRWLVMSIGLFGSYRKNEAVDVSYRIGGKTQHATDLPVIPD